MSYITYRVSMAHFDDLHREAAERRLVNEAGPKADLLHLSTLTQQPLKRRLGRLRQVPRAATPCPPVRT
jgi:hypothetical protein